MMKSEDKEMRILGIILYISSVEMCNENYAFIKRCIHDLYPFSFSSLHRDVVIEQRIMKKKLYKDAQAAHLEYLKLKRK